MKNNLHKLKRPSFVTGAHNTKMTHRPNSANFVWKKNSHTILATNMTKNQEKQNKGNYFEKLFLSLV